MKIVPILNKIPTWCPRLRAPYRVAIDYSSLPIIERPLAPSTVSNYMRADKVLNIPYFDKSISLKEVIAVTKEAIQPKKKLDAVLNKYLSKYVADENNPDRPIREIKGRIKSPVSIREKIQGLIQNIPELATKLETKTGIKEEVKDLVGKKIVLRSDNKKDTMKIIEELFNAHKNGDLNIYEVEVYSPSLKDKEGEFIKFMKNQYGKKITQKDCERIIADKEYFSYVNSNELNKLASEYDITLKYPPRNTGYTAIHVGTLLSDGFKGEIQIIGCNVEKLSNVEHQYYKAKCGKEVNPLLKERFKPLTPQYSDNEIKDLTQDYTFFAYIFERLKAKIHYKQKIDTEFLKAPQRLQELELGFNQNAPIIRGHLADNSKNRISKVMTTNRLNQNQ